MIIADHSFVAQAIRSALRHTVGLKVVAVSDGRVSTRTRLVEHQPDVVVIDEMENPKHAIARLAEIATEVPEARSILLTMRMAEEWIGQAFDAGAHAVLSKSIHPVSLGVMLGEIGRENLAMRYERPRERDKQDCPLTARELEILRLAAQGHTNSRIASELWVTEQTVKFHLSNTYRKLGVANRTEASRYAHIHDLVAPDERLAS